MTKNQLDNTTDSKSVKSLPSICKIEQCFAIPPPPKKTTNHNADGQPVSQELTLNLVLLEQEFAKLSFLIKKMKNLTRKTTHE